jgi:hypothetical protein
MAPVVVVEPMHKPVVVVEPMPKAVVVGGLPELRHDYLHPMPIVSNIRNTWHPVANMPRMEHRHATHFKLDLDWNYHGHGIEEGKFRIELKRGMQTVAEWTIRPAPHHREKQVFHGHAATHGFFFNPGVMQRGDHFHLAYHVGGGQLEHSIHIHHLHFSYWAEGQGGVFIVAQPAPIVHVQPAPQMAPVV